MFFAKHYIYTLYQLSYTRILAGMTGLEPATYGLTCLTLKLLQVLLQNTFLYFYVALPTELHPNIVKGGRT